MEKTTGLNSWRAKNKTKLLFASAAAIVTGAAVYLLGHDLTTFIGGLVLGDAGLASALLALLPQPKRGHVAATWLPLRPTVH